MFIMQICSKYILIQNNIILRMHIYSNYVEALVFKQR